MPEEPDEIGRLRNALADRLFAEGAITSGAVEKAFRDVSRHLFLPGIGLRQAYEDAAIVTVREADGRPLSSSSQPMIMAIMLEQLGMRAGERVLEIGAGTGYNAALLAHIVGDEGRVTTIDIDEEIVAAALDHLESAGFPDVSVIAADGAQGYESDAPYDGIILTVGAADIARPWVEQLAPVGRLVLPLSLRGIQRSVAFENFGDHLESVSVVDCGFMPIRGALAGAAPPFRPIKGDPLMFLVLDDDRRVNTEALAAGFEKARQRSTEPIDTGVLVTHAEAAGGLSFWIVLHDADAGQLTSVGEVEEGSAMPIFITYPGFQHTMVLIGDTGAAALVRTNPSFKRFNVGVLAIGPGGHELAGRMSRMVHAWDMAGRPGSNTLRVSVYPPSPIGLNHPAAENSTSRSIINKPNSRIVIDW